MWGANLHFHVVAIAQQAEAAAVGAQEPPELLLQLDALGARAFDPNLLHPDGEALLVQELVDPARGLGFRV